MQGLALAPLHMACCVSIFNGQIHKLGVYQSCWLLVDILLCVFLITVEGVNQPLHQSIYFADLGMVFFQIPTLVAVLYKLRKQSNSSVVVDAAPISKPVTDNSSLEILNFGLDSANSFALNVPIPPSNNISAAASFTGGEISEGNNKTVPNLTGGISGTSVGGFQSGGTKHNNNPQRPILHSIDPNSCAFFRGDG